MNNDKIKIAILLFLIGCSSSLEEDLQQGLVNGIIYAKVENASRYSNVVEVKLMGFDRSAYRFVEVARGDFKNGDFTIELPKTLAPNHLRALISESSLPSIMINPPRTLTISNKNVKVGNVSFWGVDKDGNVVTRFFPLEIDKDGNVHDVFYTYVDSDVTISGYIEREGVITFTEHDEARFIGIDIGFIWLRKINMIYSVKWKKGWNVWSFSRFNNTKGEPTEKWSPTNVIEQKWYGSEDLMEGK